MGGWLWPTMPKDTTSFNYIRAKYARDFAGGTYWFCLGRKDTDWQNDDNPPDSTVGTRVYEVLGYRKANYQTICVPDQVNGTITWRNLKLLPVASSNMFRKFNGQFPRWALIQTTITTSELPTGKYFRQIALYQDLVPKAQWDSYEYLTPSQVESPGNLIYVTNLSEVFRLTNQIEEISVLLEF